MSELIVGTHNDLDALGSMLNIEFAYPNIKKKYFHTNYADIPKFVDEMIVYAQQNGIKGFLLPDVSFSDNKDSLRKLYNAGKVVVIDHHMYPEGFWDEFPEMTIVHDKTKSATKLCNEYFKNTGKNKHLDQLTTVIDIYDIWQKDEKAFSFSQDLNEYFWHKVRATSIETLLNEIVDVDYNLPSDFTGVVQNIKETYTKAMDEYETRKLIHRSGDITICFIDDWFNQVMLKEHENNQNFVIGINSYGITRIRINQDSPYSVEQINKLRLALTGNAEYGHLHAFTYKVDNGLDNLMKEAQRIVESINSIKE